MNLQRLVSVPALFLWLAAAQAQTLTPTQTIELVREAVAGQSEQAQATHRFT